MRVHRVITTIIAAIFLSSLAQAAPLESDSPSQSTAPATTERAASGQPVEGFPIMPDRSETAGQSMADVDGNGLSDGLEAILAGKGQDDPVDVIVTFSGPGNAASAQRNVGAFDVYREFSLISGFAATMTAGQAQALAAAAGVFRVEEDAVVTVNLEAARADFGVDALMGTLGDPSSLLYTGAGINVCVIDTGVQPDHEQLSDSTPDAMDPTMFINTSRVVGFTDLVGDYFGVSQTLAYDDHGHGTHVSGIIAGDGILGLEPGADVTLAPLARGVAPAANLYVAKALAYNGSGPDSGIITALEWCVGQGADVVNMSLGVAGSSDGKDALSAAADATVDLGIAVVVAAGNSGDGEKTIGAPAAGFKVLTVGAAAEHSISQIGSALSAGVYPAPFTSHGPTKDGRTKPDIAGPGVTILSAVTNKIAIDPDPFWGGGGIVDLGCGVGCYTILSGTSMASPFLAGTVALMLEASPAPLTPDNVAQILADTAQERGETGKDNVFGHGLVDVEAAVLQAASVAASTTAFPHTVFRRYSVADNGSVQIPIAVADTMKPALAITVAIDGKSGPFGWSPDLDMILLNEFGVAFLVSNPLYPWLSDEPFIPASGTSSTCPAGEDCGLMGTQETLHIHHSAERFIVEVYPFDGFPNNGKGGDFTIELSNGYFDDVLTADAGPDQTFNDDDGDGQALATLDGRASGGLVTSYAWSDAIGPLAEGAVAELTLPIGTHSFDLTVSDGLTMLTDTVTVTVAAGGGNGGGGGGGGGNDKPCNPNKPGCV